MTTRKDYTRHGLHINAKSKTTVAKKIMQILTQHPRQDDEMVMPLHWIEQTTNSSQCRSRIVFPKKDNAHLNDKQEDGNKVRKGQLSSQTKPSETAQWMKGTTDPKECRSATETTNEEITCHGCDEQKREDDKGNIPSPQNHIQQKVSNRRKMIPHTRTDDFLWG